MAPFIAASDNTLSAQNLLGHLVLGRTEVTIRDYMERLEHLSLDATGQYFGH